MTFRYKIEFAYDGTHFAGFQVQPNERTVELVLQNAVNKIGKKPDEIIHVYASGRTDAGVHALGQVAHFDLPFDIAPKSVRRALNSLLPLDVIVNTVEKVDPNFHARFNAHDKLYRYRVSQGEFVDPFRRNYTGHFKYPLNVEIMAQSSQALVGTHDFSSFVASGGGSQNNVRTIYSVDVYQEDNSHEIIFEFNGSGFLYNQVRIMVALLLEIGSKRRPANVIPEIIEAKNRDLARGTAPASGLYLVKVNYSSTK